MKDFLNTEDQNLSKQKKIRNNKTINTKAKLLIYTYFLKIF